MVTASLTELFVCDLAYRFSDAVSDMVWPAGCLRLCPSSEGSGKVDAKVYMIPPLKGCIDTDSMGPVCIAVHATGTVVIAVGM